jgi:hypothetical protein
MKKDMSYDQIFATSRNKTEEIMKTVREKCINDKVFEQDLLNKPTETLQKEGLELQKGIRFQVVKTADEANILPDNVIPLLLENKNEALSPEDLDKVAGGILGFNLIGDVINLITGR